MDDQRIGALLRVLRIRRRLRQVDVAHLAGLSDGTMSRLERGHLDSLSVGANRRVARVLEARLELDVWSRAGDIERVASSRHAALVEALIGVLAAAGWIARPEVSFNRNGERGLIDVLAWYPASRSVLVIEVKTEIVDVGETVGTFDRKRRLAAQVARKLDVDAGTYSAALIVADTRTNHPESPTMPPRFMPRCRTTAVASEPSSAARPTRSRPWPSCQSDTQGRQGSFPVAFAGSGGRICPPGAALGSPPRPPRPCCGAAEPPRRS